jgi:drug/metabolite transporter (DMT)-like permease
VPLGLIFLGERPDRRSLFGIALAIVGIAVIVGFGHGGGSSEWAGIGLGLGSGVAYAGVIIGMRGLRGVDPVWLSAVNNLFGSMALGMWMLATRGLPVAPSPSQALGLAAFGGIQMAIPYVLFARGLKTVTAPEAALISLIEPILTPVWVVLATRELPTAPTLFGGSFLLAGIVCRYLPFGANQGGKDLERRALLGRRE